MKNKPMTKTLKEEFEKKFVKHKLFAKGMWGFEANELWPWFDQKLKEQREEIAKELWKWFNDPEDLELIEDAIFRITKVKNKKG
jgi:hypothetical protein